MFLIGGLPALLVFFIRLFVPESERWKVSVSRRVSSPLRDIFADGFMKNTLLAIAFSSIALIGTWGSVQWIPLWVDQITGGDMPHAKAVIQMVIAYGAITGCLLGPLIGGKVGRRPAFFGLCLGSLSVCAFLFRALSEYNGLFIMTVFFAGLFTAAFYGWFPLYLPELFPTRMRATGQGVSYNFGRVFAAVGAVAGGQLVAFFDGSYPQAGALVTLVYAFGLILIWFAPETKGKPLLD
jgi:MFS family permease